MALDFKGCNFILLLLSNRALYWFTATGMDSDWPHGQLVSHIFQEVCDGISQIKQGFKLGEDGLHRPLWWP